MCQYDRLYSNADKCENDPYANITITGDDGEMTLDICEDHLNQLTSQFPTEESDTARNQR